jgi:HSP20 family molecular chaperone IbpA
LPVSAKHSHEAPSGSRETPPTWRSRLLEGLDAQMSRLSLLDTSLWLSLSADGAPREAGYPPYNIELLPEDERGPQALRITLAVAGFNPDELEVCIDNGELTVRGKQREEDRKNYLHRGIATRQFKRSFPLASGVEVRRAALRNGLLAIELQRPRRERRVLKVGIVAAD